MHDLTSVLVMRAPARCWLVFLISIVTSGSSEAGPSGPHHRRDPNADDQCIDPKRNVRVNREMCGAGCCIHKGEDGQLNQSEGQDGHESKSMLYCGTQSECEMMNSTDSHQEEDSWAIIGIIVAILVLPLFAILVLLVACSIHKKLRMKQEEKEREVQTRQKIEKEFPPIMHGKAEDPECQLREDEVCCICLDGFEGTFVRKLHCGHILHMTCFDQWCVHAYEPHRVRSQNKCKDSSWQCPLCKHPILPDLEQQGAEEGQPQARPRISDPQEFGGHVLARPQPAMSRSALHQYLFCFFHQMGTYLKTMKRQIPYAGPPDVNGFDGPPQPQMGFQLTVDSSTA